MDTHNDKVTYSTPLARSSMAYVLAGGRGSRLHELTSTRAKPAVYFGGKARIIDFALSNAINSGIRRIAVATQYKAHSLIRHLQRGWNFLQPMRNESFDILPASQRVVENQWYAGTADAVYPEHRHHRQLRAGIHRRARGRPCLQDGLRADADPARQRGRGCDGRVPRGADCRGVGLGHRAYRRGRSHPCLPRKAGAPAGNAQPSGPCAGEHGHLRVPARFPERSAAARRGGPALEPRFRQGSDPVHRRARRRRGSPFRAIVHPVAFGERNPTGATSARSTLISMPTSTSPTSCRTWTCTIATGRSGPTPRSRRRRNSCTTWTVGAAWPFRRWSPAAASCPDRR